MAHIVCWRSGEAEVVGRKPEGSISLMRGPAKRLNAILTAVARHAYDGVTLLVPGVPEAENDDQALTAICAFQIALERRLNGTAK